MRSSQRERVPQALAVRHAPGPPRIATIVSAARRTWRGCNQVDVENSVREVLDLHDELALHAAFNRFDIGRLDVRARVTDRARDVREQPVPIRFRLRWMSRS